MKLVGDTWNYYAELSHKILQESHEPPDLQDKFVTGWEVIPKTVMLCGWWGHFAYNDKKIFNFREEVSNSILEYDLYY